MPKRVKIAILFSIFLLLCVGGVAWYQISHQQPEFQNEVTRNLTDESRTIFESRITDNTKKLSETSDSAAKFELYSKLGFDANALGHLKASKEYFEEAVKISPEEYGVRVGLFQTLVDMKDFKAAEINIKKALEIRPSSADIWKRYIQFKIDFLNASEQQVTDLYSDAISKTSSIKGSQTDIYTSYATWLESKRRYQAAKEYWQKALELNPSGKALYDPEIKRLDDLLKQENSK